MWEAFLIFFNKNISVFGYKVLKYVTSQPLNELVKLTMFWTTGPELLSLSLFTDQLAKAKDVVLNFKQGYLCNFNKIWCWVSFRGTIDWKPFWANFYCFFQYMLPADRTDFISPWSCYSSFSLVWDVSTELWNFWESLKEAVLFLKHETSKRSAFCLSSSLLDQSQFLDFSPL